MSISTSAINDVRPTAAEPCQDLDFCRDLNPRGSNIRNVQPPQQVVSGIEAGVGMGGPVPGLHGSAYGIHMHRKKPRWKPLRKSCRQRKGVAFREGVNQISMVSKSCDNRMRPQSAKAKGRRPYKRAPCGVV